MSKNEKGRFNGRWFQDFLDWFVMQSTVTEMEKWHTNAIHGNMHRASMKEHTAGKKSGLGVFFFRF